MIRLFDQHLSERQSYIIEIVIIVAFALIPVFATYPYRINIFLSWEGAYRMYLGQIPFKDFGIPVGYGYWLVPSLFFKIFGPYLASLVKAQAFINIVSGLSFRALLKALDVDYGIRLLSVFLFVVSYSFFNFWPWYNHSVIVYEIAGLALLVMSFERRSKLYTNLLTFTSALLLFLSFFTKQDGGFFAIAIGTTLTCYYSIVSRTAIPLTRFLAYLCAIAAIIVVPLIKYDFLYWFNYGQAPHYSRISLTDILDEFLYNSQFIKFYLLIIVGICLVKFRNLKAFFHNKKPFMLLLLTIGILVQASVLQVTSYTPPDGNIYFHSFCFAFILSNLKSDLNFASVKVASIFSAFIFLWWSATYWTYISRVVARIIPSEQSDNFSERISINTYKIEKDSTELDKSTWTFSGLRAFDRVYMPKGTLDGIKRLKSLDLWSQQEKPRVLNMTELTPLAHELGYELEKNQPLWYHLNVALFDKELMQFKHRINDEYYDLVLFEVIPNLNNFNPDELREALQKNYDLIDVFQAPRRKTTEVIEVYRKRQH